MKPLVLGRFFLLATEAGVEPAPPDIAGHPCWIRTTPSPLLPFLHPDNVPRFDKVGPQVFIIGYGPQFAKSVRGTSPTVFAVPG